MRRSAPRSASRLPALVAGLALLACAPLTIPEERELGDQVNSQIREEVDLVRDDVVVNYVRDIGRSIVRAAGPQPFTYRFYVVDHEQINAFALPAGYIYMHTETILKAANVSEVAGVMGHEVGHVVKRHVANNYRRAQGVGIAHQVGVITAAILGGQAAAEAANIGGGLAGMAYLNNFGRDAERESDAFAVQVLPRAGYDPNGMVTFFETMMRESKGGHPLPFLSSHPATDERIRNTRRLIAAANLPRGLTVHDGGKLEIVKRRIRLLRGK